LVRAGSLVIDPPPGPRRDLAADAVAEASAFLWQRYQDTQARDLSIELDLGEVEAGRHTLPRLRRLADLAEAAERDDVALHAWLLTMAAVAQGEEAWFEARYHSARLLSR